VNIDIKQEKETVIHTYLKRTKHGVRVDVLVDPEVEEFFQHWGTGKQANVTSMAGHGNPILSQRKAKLELSCWHGKSTASGMTRPGHMTSTVLVAA